MLDQPDIASGQDRGRWILRVLSVLCTWSLVMGACVAPPAFANLSSSANFKKPVDAVNSGAPSGSSANFNMGSSIGDGFSAPTGMSANFISKSGFQPVNLLATPQTIAFGANPGPVTYAPAGTFTVSATGGASGNAVIFSISTTTSVCSVSGATVTILSVGNCTVAADQAGNSTYSSAPQVTQSITINKANQATLSATSTLTTLNINQTATLSAVGGSGTGAVTFASNNANCTVTAVITLTAAAAGGCIIVASKAADTNYNVATSAGLAITTNLIAQTITFNPPASVTVGDPPITVAATGGASANPVTFTSLTATICTSGGTNGATIIFTGSIGTCTIRANQAGNATYAAAANTDRGIAVASATPPPSPPTAPTNLICVTGANTITCGFGPSTTSGSTVITGYQLYCRDAQGNTYIQTNISTTITLAGLPKGRLYTCEVTALSTNGASGASNRFVSALKLIPLALQNYFDFDGAGFATILARSSGKSGSGISGATASTAATVAAVITQAAAVSYIGRFDGSKLSFTPIADIGDQWAILGAGDINSSYKSSLISRNASDDVRVDFTLPPLNGTILRKAKSDWVVEAIIDLDGDGRADILWRYMKPGTDDSGVVFAWYMDANNSDPNNAAVSINEIKRRGGAPLSWNLIGATDIDGDGKADLIWLSPTNDLRALVGTTGRNWTNQLIGTLPTGYSIIKLGDVNGDGRGDIVFKDASGKVKVWLMNGINITLDINLPTIDPTWTFFASGDYNGDGTLDIVWKKPDGTLVLWLMNGNNPSKPTVIDNVGTAPTGAVAIEL